MSDFSPGKWNNWFSFRHVTYQHFITLSTFCVVALTLHFFSDIKKSMGSRFDVSLLCTLTAMLNLKHFMICAICCDWCHAFIWRPSSKRSIVVWLWVHHEVPPPVVPLLLYPPRHCTHPHIPLWPSKISHKVGAIWYCEWLFLNRARPDQCLVTMVIHSGPCVCVCAYGPY